MNDNHIVRIPPHNKSAEQSVIGSMILDENRIDEVADILSRDDFYVPAYGAVFEAIVDLKRKGSPADTVTILEKLHKKGESENLIDAKSVSEIVMTVPTSVRIMDYAKIVKEKSLLRKLIKVCDDIEKDCYIASDDADSIFDSVEKQVFQIINNRNGSLEYVPMNRIILNVIDRIEEAARNGGKPTGLPTGFKDLDTILNGMDAGQLILIAARPAMGKTAFALNIVHYLSVHKQIPCAFFSLEMDPEELGARLVALDAGVNSEKIKMGEMPDDDWDKLIESTDVMSKAPIYVFNKPNLTISDIRTQCMQLKLREGLKLIVLDYLQLMNPDYKAESRQSFIADVSRSLKNLARELEVPIIALSQLNRAIEGRTDKRPIMSDLRESGAIEQDADVIMFIYRDEVYNPETAKPKIAEIIVSKHRNGAIGKAELAWLGEYTKFANLAYDGKNGKEG